MRNSDSTLIFPQLPAIDMCVVAYFQVFSDFKFLLGDAKNFVNKLPDAVKILIRDTSVRWFWDSFLPVNSTFFPKKDRFT